MSPAMMSSTSSFFPSSVTSSSGTKPAPRTAPYMRGCACARCSMTSMLASSDMPSSHAAASSAPMSRKIASSMSLGKPSMIAARVSVLTPRRISRAWGASRSSRACAPSAASCCACKLSSRRAREWASMSYMVRAAWAASVLMNSANAAHETSPSSCERMSAAVAAWSLDMSCAPCQLFRSPSPLLPTTSSSMRPYPSAPPAQDATSPRLSSLRRTAIVSITTAASAGRIRPTTSPAVSGSMVRRISPSFSGSMAARTFAAPSSASPETMSTNMSSSLISGRISARAWWGPSKNFRVKGKMRTK
mmetsp:Transcript_28706/g.91600  ORF Transcript_28706/g.91600 Transcript_28706/m.91600 type:complete len:304 (-) Transcript_28706:12-923(-)